jgi:hypothetical protein
MQCGSRIEKGPNGIVYVLGSRLFRGLRDWSLLLQQPELTRRHAIRLSLFALWRKRSCPQTPDAKPPGLLRTRAILVALAREGQCFLVSGRRSPKLRYIDGRIRNVRSRSTAQESRQQYSPEVRAPSRITVMTMLYRAAIHQSLTRPMLLAGAERAPAIANWIMAAGTLFGGALHWYTIAAG